MARVFVQHDENGKILATAVVETMAPEMEHPFFLSNPAHGALELGRGNPAPEGDLSTLHDTHMVDLKAGAVVPRSNLPERPPRKRTSPPLKDKQDG